MIKKENDQYVVYDVNGSKIGTHNTKEKAIAQLRAIEAAKHRK